VCKLCDSDMSVIEIKTDQSQPFLGFLNTAPAKKSLIAVGMDCCMSSKLKRRNYKLSINCSRQYYW
jgi:hypothetical protein